jgi:hypoxanthine phosphoribosyltransferase
MVKEVVKVHDKEFSLMIPAAEIQVRVADIADRIDTAYTGKDPLFLGVLNGAFLFMADLLRHITIPCELSFIKVASYDGTAATGRVRQLIGLEKEIAGRHVVIVEDIVDTGDTMRFLYEELAKARPASIRLATLLFKPAALQRDVQPDYVGFEIAPEFVVGYGLDYNGHGRNLNDLYTLKQT